MVLAPGLADRLSLVGGARRRLGVAAGVLLLLWVGCGEPRREARVPSSQAAPDLVEVAAPSEGDAEYSRLLELRQRASGGALLRLDADLKLAEQEHPLDFRFSYERAKLVVFGRRDHHEAFQRLRRAAEKAIETERSGHMLEMLRADGARAGPFWKLSRGHSEWNRILQALEQGNRDQLWHEHHAAAPAAAEDSREALARLLVVRGQVHGGHGEQEP